MASAPHMVVEAILDCVVNNDAFFKGNTQA